MLLAVGVGKSVNGLAVLIRGLGVGGAVLSGVDIAVLGDDIQQALGEVHGCLLYTSMIGSGGMVVMDEDTCMVEVARFFMSFTQRESCGKCVPCREGTQRMLEILERIVAGQGTMEDLDTLRDLADMIENTALCGLGKSAPKPVISTLNAFRDEYVAHIRDRRCPAGVCSKLRVYSIDPAKCKGCSKCARMCPVGAISGEIRSPFTIDPDKCIKCGACFDGCSFHAVKEG